MRRVDWLVDVCENTWMQRNAKQEAILQAAGEQFNRYGYRKTSMDDIARRMGVSRASLYSYFENKDEIFRSVSLVIHQRALKRAKYYLFAEETRTQALAIKVENALLSRHSPFLKAVIRSAHGDELFDEYSRVCGDIVQDSHAAFQTLLAKALNSASKTGYIDLKAAGMTGKNAAEVLNLGAAGLKQGSLDALTFRRRIRRLVKVFLSGLKVS